MPEPITPAAAARRGRLAGRVAVVTGVSRRIAIGAAVARRLAADGADLALHGWPAHDAEQPWGADPGGPAALAEELRAGGTRVVDLRSDLADTEAPEAVVASKGALHQVTPSLAVYLAPRGITVNCVDPGPNDTGYADDVTRQAVVARIPAGRWGRPEDTARVVAWLVSDEAAWVTGQVIASDGGWSAL